MPHDGYTRDLSEIGLSIAPESRDLHETGYLASHMVARSAVWSATMHQSKGKGISFILLRRLHGLAPHVNSHPRMKGNV